MIPFSWKRRKNAFFLKKKIGFVCRFGKKLYLCTRFREATRQRDDERTATIDPWQHSITDKQYNLAWLFRQESVRNEKRTVNNLKIFIPASTNKFWIVDTSDEVFTDIIYNEEFDPGSGWTLATGLTHASRGVSRSLLFRDDRRTGE